MPSWGKGLTKFERKRILCKNGRLQDSKRNVTNVRDKSLSLKTRVIFSRCLRRGTANSSLIVIIPPSHYPAIIGSRNLPIVSSSQEAFVPSPNYITIVTGSGDTRQATNSLIRLYQRSMAARKPRWRSFVGSCSSVWSSHCPRSNHRLSMRTTETVGRVKKQSRF